MSSNTTICDVRTAFDLKKVKNILDTTSKEFKLVVFLQYGNHYTEIQVTKKAILETAKNAIRTTFYYHNDQTVSVEFQEY